jgi:hypothetical protein
MMKELVDLGVIEPISYVKKAPKQWQIEVEQSKQSQKRSQAKNPEHQLISELMNRGVHEPSAKRLVEEFDKSQIERNLAVFDSLMKQQPSQRPKKPPGFLTWAIRVDYASQHKMEMGRLETKRQRGRGQPVPKASGRVAVDQSGERREPDSKRAAIASYLSGLSDDERMQLEAEALRQAGPMVADGYDRSKKAGNQKAFEDYRQLILEKHLVELLGLN